MNRFMAAHVRGVRPIATQAPVGLGAATEGSTATCNCPTPTSGWVWALVGAGVAWGATKIGTEFLDKRKKG